METPEEIAQWVIDNRYPKEEKRKVPDLEMYYIIIGAIRKLLTPSTMNKPDCCNAELIGAVARGWCSDKNKHKEMDTDLAEAIVMEVQKLKPKTTKYYQVKSTVAGITYMQIITGENPIKALNTFQLNNPRDAVTDIKLIEIIQEDTTNQE